MRLAENYLPGCVCLLKGCILSSCLFLVEHNQVPVFFIVLGICLGLDRVCEPRRILDGSALLWCAYASRVVRYAASIEREDGLVVSSICLRGMYLVWFTIASVFVYPGGVRHLFSTCAAARGGGEEQCCSPEWASNTREASGVSHLYLVFTAVCMCVELFGQGHTHSSLEFECARVMVYLTLSVVWVYAVGLLRPRECLAGAGGSASLAPLFAPLLYLPQWMGIVFLAWGVWCIVRGHGGTHEPPPSPSTRRTPAPPATTAVVVCATGVHTAGSVTGTTRVSDLGLDLRKGGGIGGQPARGMDTIDLGVQPITPSWNRPCQREAPSTNTPDTPSDQNEYEDIAEQFRLARENALKRA